MSTCSPLWQYLPYLCGTLLRNLRFANDRKSSLMGSGQKRNWLVDRTEMSREPRVRAWLSAGTQVRYLSISLLVLLCHWILYGFSRYESTSAFLSPTKVPGKPWIGLACITYLFLNKSSPSEGLASREGKRGRREEKRRKKWERDTDDKQKCNTRTASLSPELSCCFHLQYCLKNFASKTGRGLQITPSSCAAHVLYLCLPYLLHLREMNAKLWRSKAYRDDAIQEGNCFFLCFIILVIIMHHTRWHLIILFQ